MKRIENCFGAYIALPLALLRSFSGKLSLSCNRLPLFEIK
jgi:hypothetical protein